MKAHNAYERAVFTLTYRTGDYWAECRFCGNATWLWAFRNRQHKHLCERPSFGQWMRTSPDAEPYREEALRDVRVRILTTEMNPYEDGHSDADSLDEIERQAEVFRSGRHPRW